MISSRSFRLSSQHTEMFFWEASDCEECMGQVLIRGSIFSATRRSRCKTSWIQGEVRFRVKFEPSNPLVHRNWPPFFSVRWIDLDETFVRGIGHDSSTHLSPGIEAPKPIWMWVKMEDLEDHRYESSLVLTIQLLGYLILTHTHLSRICALLAPPQCTESLPWCIQRPPWPCEADPG